MAIRSTNANRAAKAGRNTDGPGNTSVDYGKRPPGSQSMQDRIDRRRDEYGDSPWLGRDGKPMPWSGPDGQQRGQRAPMFTPDAGNPANRGYFKNQSTPEEIAAEAAAAKSRYGDARELLYADPEYMAAKSAGDMRGQIAAMQALKQRMELDRWHSMGLRAPSEATQEDIDNAIRPRSPLGTATNGPGRGTSPGGRTGPASAMSAGGAKGGAPGGAMPGGGASTGQDAIGNVAVEPGNITPDVIDRLRGGLFDLGRGAGVPQGPGGFGQAGGTGAPPMAMPNNMGSDAARKLAQGMPAKFLDPNYRPGRS